MHTMWCYAMLQLHSIIALTAFYLTTGLPKRLQQRESLQILVQNISLALICPEFLTTPNTQSRVAAQRPAPA